MGLTLISGPATEPVSLAEAKLHCRVDGTDDDTWFTSFAIPTARLHAEAITGRALITQQWRLVGDDFPAGAIDLPKPTLLSVESVKYLDSAGVLQTLSAGAYTVSTFDLLGRIEPAYGTTWPAVRSGNGAVRIEFTAGYGNAAAVPAAIKAWMLCAIAEAYDRRGTTIDRALQTNPYVDHLLDAYRVVVAA